MLAIYGAGCAMICIFASFVCPSRLLSAIGWSIVLMSFVVKIQ